MRFAIRAAASLACVVACGSSSTTPAADSGLASGPRVAAIPRVDASGESSVTAQGTLGGRPFSAWGAIALFEAMYGPGIPPLVMVGLPENFTLNCDALTNASHPPGIRNTPAGRSLASSSEPVARPSNPPRTS